MYEQVHQDKSTRSHLAQGHLTAFLDDVEPEIAGSNTGRNEATITLTDKGDGIDEDGITLIEDDDSVIWIVNFQLPL